MNYRTSAKKRRTKRILEKIMYLLTFGGRRFSGGEKVLIVGLVIATVGIFRNWIEYASPANFYNGFYDLLGWTGYILVFNTLLIIFLLLGGKKKEQVKNYFHIYAKDSILIICLLVTNFLFTLNGFFIINSALMVQANISHQSGIVVTMVWYLLAIFGEMGEVYFSRSEKMYIDQSLKDEEKAIYEESHNHNMKLPF